MRSRPSPSLFLLTFCLAGAVAGAAVSGFGCAGVKPNQTTTGAGGSGNHTGSGGSGNALPMPSIQGLTGISVSPDNAQLVAVRRLRPGHADGHHQLHRDRHLPGRQHQDVTSMVNWSSNPCRGC